MPLPTPAYITAAHPSRPAAESRSITREDANTITNAPAAPPTKRSSRNAPRLVVNAMAPAVSPLSASAAKSQIRRSPGAARQAAARAPTKYPR